MIFGTILFFFRSIANVEHLEIIVAMKLKMLKRLFKKWLTKKRWNLKDSPDDSSMISQISLVVYTTYYLWMTCTNLEVIYNTSDDVVQQTSFA